MNRTFRGTVNSINPTVTSNYVGGYRAVSIHVDSAQLGSLSFDATVMVPPDDARELGALIGVPDAVLVSVSTSDTRSEPIPDVGHYFTAGARLCRREEEGSAVVADVYASRVGKLTESEHATRLAHALNSANEDTVRWIVTDGNDPNSCANGEFGVEVNGKAYIYYKWPDATTSDVGYRQIHKREFGETIRVERNSGSSQPDAISAAVDLPRVDDEREGALINGEKLAISLLREVVAFASDTKMHNDHTGAVNWLLEFIERPDVRTIATGVNEPTDRAPIAKTMIDALTDEEWERVRPRMCSGCFCRQR